MDLRFISVLRSDVSRAPAQADVICCLSVIIGAMAPLTSLPPRIDPSLPSLILAAVIVRVVLIIMILLSDAAVAHCSEKAPPPHEDS